MNWILKGSLKSLKPRSVLGEKVYGRVVSTLNVCSVAKCKYPFKVHGTPKLVIYLRATPYRRFTVVIYDICSTLTLLPMSVMCEEGQNKPFYVLLINTLAQHSVIFSLLTKILFPQKSFFLNNTKTKVQNCNSTVAYTLPRFNLQL